MSGNSALDMMMKQKMYEQMGMDSGTAALMAMQGQGDKNDSSMFTMMALSGGMGGGASGTPNTMIQTMMTAKMLEGSGVDPTVAFMQAQMMQQQGSRHGYGQRQHEVAEFGRQTFCNAFSAGNTLPPPQPMAPPQYGLSFTSQYSGYPAPQGMPPAPTAPAYGGYCASQGMTAQSSAPYGGYPQGNSAPTQFPAPQSMPEYMPVNQYSAPAAPPPSRPRYGFIR